MAARLAAVTEELQSLRAENARLRGLLGLDHKRSADPTPSWEPTLFVAASPPGQIDRHSPPEAKIALFQSLFHGRKDVYALRWQNDRTSKSGWSPAVRGGWANSKRPDRECLPLTDR